MSDDSTYPSVEVTFAIDETATPQSQRNLAFQPGGPNLVHRVTRGRGDVVRKDTRCSVGGNYYKQEVNVDYADIPNARELYKLWALLSRSLLIIGRKVSVIGFSKGA